MKRFLCAAFVGALILGCGSKIYSQNVGINADGSAPNANAMLDVASPATGNGKGMLIPRISQAQRTTASAALAGGLLDDSGNLRGGASQGLLVYQTNSTQGFYYNTSATSTPSWILLIPGISDSAGNSNTAIGYQTLSSNTAGSCNIAIGYQALNLNTTGSNNTASGYQALCLNKDGYNNTAYGFQALSSDVGVIYPGGEGNNNTANGYWALFNNTIGYNNTASGCQSLSANLVGFNNTAYGYRALYNNVSNENTAVGVEALLGTNGVSPSGAKNTALGFQAGGNNSTGFNNTFIGYSANASSSTLWNATAIGSEAMVSTSNTVIIGNSAVTNIGGFAGWFTMSDRREKKDISDCNIGLTFIEKLRPVNYKYLKQDKILNGFIAQDVEHACDELGIEFGGLTKPENENGRYMLSYSEFVVPLVNAVKELKTENDELKAELKAIKEKLGME